MTLLDAAIIKESIILEMHKGNETDESLKRKRKSEKNAQPDSGDKRYQISEFKSPRNEDK